MNDLDLPATLELIYDAAVSPGRWPDLLRHLAPAFACHFASVKFTSANRQEFRAIAHGMDPAVHHDFLRRYDRTDPIGLRLSPNESDDLQDSSILLTRRELEQSEMYQAVLRPHDVGRVRCLNIWHGRAGHITLSLARSWRAGAFAEPLQPDRST